MTGLLNPESSGKKMPNLSLILVVYLGQGIPHPPAAVFVLSLLIRFFGGTEVSRSQIEEPQKNSGAPLSWHASNISISPAKRESERRSVAQPDGDQDFYALFKNQHY